MSNLESRRKTFNEICKKNIIVIIMIVFLCPILGISYATFITSTDGFKSNEMYIGKLLYSISTYKVPNLEPEVISYLPTNEIRVAPNSNATVYVKVESLNQVSTYYKLLYNDDPAISVYFAKDQNEKAVSGLITTEKVSTIIITNSSNELKTVTLNVAGGYNTNSLESVEIPTGYAYVEEDYYRFSYETVAIFVGSVTTGYQPAPEGLLPGETYDLASPAENPTETVLSGVTNCTNGATPSYNRNTKLLTIAPDDNETDYAKQVPTKCVLYFNTIDAASFAEAVINDNKVCLDENETPIVCSDNVASTYVTSADGIDFSAKSSLTNGQGLYRDVKNGDGSNYYFRGGVVCKYTNYESEVPNGNKCTTLGGIWENHRCSYNKSQSNCTSATFQWNEINNNVMFGGYAWKIIRIEEEDGKYYTHLLYNGLATDANGGDVMITKSTYYSDINFSAPDAMFVGYMYNTDYINNYGMSSDISEARDNAENSLVKSAIDAWYSGGFTNGSECNGGTCNFSGLTTKIITYENKLANRVFCNDRSLSTSTPNGGYATEATTYDGYDRTYNTRIPTFDCSLASDKFTLSATAPGIVGSASYGNNKLTYPIGLITADELVYAGAIKITQNYNTYVQAGGTNGLYWSMTPGTITSDNANSIVMTATGALANQSTSVQKGVRPVIVLNNDAKITSGNGTLATPYLIKMVGV